MIGIFNPKGWWPAKESPLMGAVHESTIRQIEEARAAVAEVTSLKKVLVARANGALYDLKKGARGDGKGDSEEKL